MTSTAVPTLVEQFSRPHMEHLARDFSFPCVPSMVRTWGYLRTYHMAVALCDALLAHKKVFHA